MRPASNDIIREATTALSRQPATFKSAVLNIGEETSNDSGSLAKPIPLGSISHQRYLTIATMFKNKRRWVREWIEFHLMMGAEHFIMYDNDSTDFPLEVLQYYIDQGLVTYIPWPPKEVPPPPESFKTQLEEWQYSLVQRFSRDMYFRRLGRPSTSPLSTCCIRRYHQSYKRRCIKMVCDI